MTSVIVPAHNEAGVIGRCLSALTTGAAAGELDIVVVCNGCTDGTAAVAARYAPHVRVIDTPTASKPHALNLGDAAARSFPRLYVDADVELDVQAVRGIVAALATGALAAAPGLQLDARRSSRAVRAYHRIWVRLPVIRDGLVGRGVYALSEAGRERFGAFPDVIADDLFVHSRFRPGERVSVQGCHSVVRAPRTLRELVRRKSRVLAGNRELAARGEAQPTTASWLRTVVEQPRLLPSVPAYVTVSLLVRAAAAVEARRGRQGVWQRDESGRGEGDEDPT